MGETKVSRILEIFIEVVEKSLRIEVVLHARHEYQWITVKKQNPIQNEPTKKFKPLSTDGH